MKNNFLIYDYRKLIVALALSFLLARGLNLWLYGKAHLFELMLGWSIITFNFTVTYILRKKALGKKASEFFKITLGWNGFKIVLLLLIVGILVALRAVDIRPFITTIFSIYIFCTIYELVFLYLANRKPSALENV